MNRFNTKQDRDWKYYFQQVLAAAAATFIIVWFLPRDNITLMPFKVDRPWAHDPLITTFEFPVLKSQEQLQAERDSIRRIYSPYYELLTAVEQEQVKAFHSQQAADLPYHYRTFIEQRLHTVYQQGIISTSEMQRIKEDSCTAIFVYSGNDAVKRRIDKLFTQKTAYEYLVSEIDSAGLQRTKLQSLNLNQFVKNNLRYDEVKSDEKWNSLVASLTNSEEVIFADQRIIDRGAVVTKRDSLVLESYERELKARYASSHENNMVLWGQALYVAVIIICLIFYFNLFRRDYISSWRSVLLLSALVLSFSLFTSFLMRHMLLSVYIVPYAMLPVFVRVFMDSRTAFFTYVCTILLCAIPLHAPFVFVVTQLMAGLVAIYSLRELSERSQLFRTAILSTFVALVIFASLELILNPISSDFELKDIDFTFYKHILISGVLLLFAYPLMYLLERLFGFTSNVTLVELSNVNRPLLRRLSETAPGTFQHSVMVSNLAAEVANQIGAKTQLVRTGALYHDIGKMENPEFFTENQLGGVNPHNRLTNRESAAIILRHVTDGLELADRYELPRIIRDMIATHHGCGMAKYFYISEQNAHPGEKINAADFTYVGPNPSTTEQAILMMCDTVEASARSLSEYTEENIGQLVDRIIDTQVAEGYFQHCPITFLDIQNTKDVLKERLKGIYHTRVSYPTLNQ